MTALGRFLARLAAGLASAQLVVVLLSWVWSATSPETGVRSLLSSEAVRWFLGSFATMLATPYLVWLLLVTMAAGCVWRSGLCSVRPSDYRQQTAVRIVILLLLLSIAAVAALTVVPHAVLLSPTGQLFPSPFSRALVPLLAFLGVVSGATFGLASGRYSSLGDVFGALCWGLGRGAPLVVIYILAAQLFHSVLFVFG